jgi:hypothetical protein
VNGKSHQLTGRAAAVLLTPVYGVLWLLMAGVYLLLREETKPEESTSDARSSSKHAPIRGELTLASRALTRQSDPA